MPDWLIAVLVIGGYCAGFGITFGVVYALDEDDASILVPCFLWPLLWLFLVVIGPAAVLGWASYRAVRFVRSRVAS